MLQTIPGEAILAQMNWRYGTKAFDPDRHIPASDWNGAWKSMTAFRRARGLT